jgi:hypothetical protein
MLDMRRREFIVCLAVRQRSLIDGDVLGPAIAAEDCPKYSYPFTAPIDLRSMLH